MNKKEESLLHGKRKKLMEKFCSLPPWIDGSIIESERVQSGKKKSFNYLSRSEGGKNRTTYISGEHLKAFQKARLNGKLAKKIFNEIIEINIKLLKNRKNDVEK